MRFYKVGGAGEKQCSWRRVPRHRAEGGGGWVGSAGFAAARAARASIGNMADCVGIRNMADCVGIGNMADCVGGWMADCVGGSIGYTAKIAAPCINCR